jgi:hypothetical protein
MTTPQTVKPSVQAIREAIARECQSEIKARSGIGQELEYRIDLQRENDDYKADDYALAMFDIENWLEGHNSPKSDPMFKALRDLMIRAGVVREITDEELSRTTVTGGTRGKRSLYFTYKGKKWTHDHPNCNFHNEE